MPRVPTIYRLLNTPRPVTVESAQGRPVALVDRQGEHVAIAAIEEAWVIDEEWWRDRIWRAYYRVRLADGRIVTIYLDRETGRWFEQRY